MVELFLNGINIGTDLSDMPHPTQVVALLKSQQISHVRLYDADQGMLVASPAPESKSPSQSPMNNSSKSANQTPPPPTGCRTTSLRITPPPTSPPSTSVPRFSTPSRTSIRFLSPPSSSSTALLSHRISTVRSKFQPQLHPL